MSHYFIWIMMLSVDGLTNNMFWESELVCLEVKSNVRIIHG